ncbi:MAG: septum formation initiator family protein [Candidatus Dormibacteraeota bacterium]|nr:septum formation initiator family protein [Candidatus Dormibacteraeota bacterium]
MGDRTASSCTRSRGPTILRHVIAPDASPLRRLVIAGLAALSGLAAYAVFSAAAQSNALDARVRALNAQNSTLQQQIAQRSQQIGETNNVAWLEGQARRLGFVFPGETIFIITTPGAALPASGGINAVLPTYAPSPSPSSSPSASPGPSPSSSPAASATPRPSPTPLVFVMPSPSAH